MTAGIKDEDISAIISNVAWDKARGNVTVHGLWEKEKTCILDIRTTDTDAKSYTGSSLEKVLEKVAKLKKDKYEAPCFAMRRTFTPLV